MFETHFVRINDDRIDLRSKLFHSLDKLAFFLGEEGVKCGVLLSVR